MVRLAHFALLLILTGVAVALISCVDYVRPKLNNAASGWFEFRFSPREAVQTQKRFVYMVTGKGLPSGQWRELSNESDVTVLFAAWKHRLTESQVKTYTNEQLLVYFYPNSSWATCRNFLFQKALNLEQSRGQQFEYFLFADEDVMLGWRTPANRTLLHMNHSLTASRLLHDNLMRDKPARASVDYQTGPGPRIDGYPVDCVQSCAFDGALDIYHRSIARHILPYFTHYEARGWQMSMFMNNVRSQALFDGYCYLYRDVFIDPDNNEHGSYPSNIGLINEAMALLKRCFAPRGVPMSQRTGERPKQTLMRALKRPRPMEKTPPCTSQSADVNYSLVLQTLLEKWPAQC